MEIPLILKPRKCEGTSGKRYFLSASIPDPERPDTQEDVKCGFPAAPDEIRAAVIDIASKILNEGATLVFGGHPLITPIVSHIAQNLLRNKSRGGIVIFQSAFFAGKEPGEVRDKRVYDVLQWTPICAPPLENPRPQYPDLAIGQDPSECEAHQKAMGSLTALDDKTKEQIREASLFYMRKKMLEKCDAGIFIGGMKGIEDELRLFESVHPGKPVWLITHPGGRAARIARQQAPKLHRRIQDESCYERIAGRILSNGERYALLIGINQFAHDSQGGYALRNAENDVMALSGHLADNALALPYQVSLLTSGGASPERATFPRGVAGKTEIVAQLQECAQIAQSSDTPKLFVVYLSTHGYYSAQEKDCYLFPYGCELEKRAEDMQGFLKSCLSGKDLMKYLSALQTKSGRNRVVCILDCCHAGGVPPYDFTSLSEQAHEALAYGSGAVVIGACKHNERAVDHFSAEDKHGVFAQALLNALSGEADYKGEGLIKILFLFDHVSSQVQTQVRDRLHESQTPVLKTLQLDENFVFVESGGVRKAACTNPEEIENRLLQQAIPRDLLELLRRGEAIISYPHWVLQNTLQLDQYQIPAEFRVALCGCLTANKSPDNPYFINTVLHFRFLELLVRALLAKGCHICYGGHPTWSPIITASAEKTLSKAKRKEAVAVYYSRTFVEETTPDYLAQMEEQLGRLSLYPDLASMREAMFNQAQAVIIMGGTKPKEPGRKSGMQEEYEAAIKHGKKVLPIGLCGGAGRADVLPQVKQNLAHTPLTLAELEKLDDKKTPLEEAVKLVLQGLAQTR